MSVYKKQAKVSFSGGAGVKHPSPQPAGQGPLVQHSAGSEHTADMRATVRSDQVLSLDI